MGGLESDLREVISFRGLFSDQARAGEWVLGEGEFGARYPSVCSGLLSPDGSGGQVGDYLVSRTNP